LGNGSRMREVVDDVDKETEQKIKQATEGMPKEAENFLQLEKGNATIIANYLIAYKSENDVKDSTRFNHYHYLIRFARKMNKPFIQVTSEDISTYMAGFEKSEDEDPCHQWKGTYNLFAQIITCFFKWFCFPMLPPRERPKPDILTHIQKKSIVSKMMKYTNQAICGLWRIMRFFEVLS
jgi:hypothetical protein